MSRNKRTSILLAIAALWMAVCACNCGGGPIQPENIEKAEQVVAENGPCQAEVVDLAAWISNLFSCSAVEQNPLSQTSP